MSGELTIDDVEYVADAVILGHLRAALVNIDYAAKDFKRHHFELKGTDIAQKVEWLRSLTRQVLGEFTNLCNERVQGKRLNQDRKKMQDTWKKRLKGWANI